MALKYWRPRAGAIPHIVTVTFGGTPGGGDTVTIDINDTPLTVTVGALTATTDVANAVEAAWVATSATDGLIGTESRNVGGAQLAEHSTITCEASSNTVILRGITPGVPFAITESKTGAVTISQATTQTATGPWHADNADNWSGGALPANTDTIIFDAGSTSCLYGLTYYRTNTLATSVLITSDFAGSVGLPWWNASGYQEYNPRFFQLYDAGGAESIDIVPGSLGTVPGGSQVFRFDAQSQTWDEIRVKGGMGTPGVGGSRLEVHGGSVDLLAVEEGWAAIDPDDAEQSAGMTVDKVQIGKTDGSITNPRVTIGQLTAWNASDTAIDILGGTLDLFNVLDPGTAEATPVNVYGGIVRAWAEGDLNTITVREGAFVWNGAGTAQATVTVWGGGELDISGSPLAKTFGTLSVYAGATLKLGIHTPTITPVGCNLEDITITR